MQNYASIIETSQINVYNNRSIVH